MTSLLTLVFGDESQEKFSVGFHTPTLSVANFENYAGIGVGTSTDALIAAVQAFSRGEHMRTTLGYADEVSADFPTDAEAQGEWKAMFRYRETVGGVPGRVYRFEIPVYNLAGKLAGMDDINPASSQWTNLETALEDFVGPNGGTITLLSGKLVGRNV